MTKPTCSVPECESPARARGYCTLHYQRWKNRGDPGPARPEKFRGWPMRERFLAYVEAGPDGWLWIGGRDGDGYGTFYFEGRKLGAHRVAWEMFVGPIPDGMELDHICRVRHCVKPIADEYGPAHLRLMTHTENVLIGEGWAGIHARSTTCPRGHEYDKVKSNGARWCSTCERLYDRRTHSYRRDIS